jgi:hypothetical protein
LSQGLLRADSDISDTGFSPEEGPSFCSRPTPVTAVPEALRAFGEENSSVDESGIVPRSSRQADSWRPSGDGLEQAFFQGPKPSLPPSLPPPVVRRPVSRARTAVSLMLFVTLFGGVAALLGLALLQEGASTPGELVGAVKAFVASVR